MLNERTDFIEALVAFIYEELRHSDEEADYNREAIQIVDVRNHLFRNVGPHLTDEETGIYAIRELCRLDDDTFNTVPDRERIAAIAREAGLKD